MAEQASSAGKSELVHQRAEEEQNHADRPELLSKAAKQQSLCPGVLCTSDTIPSQSHSTGTLHS